MALLDGRDAVDPAVVGVALVVVGDQAGCIGVAELAQRQQAQVPIEQNVQAVFLVALAHAQWLDQPDLFHRRHDLLELA
ncbi:hypothetical protein D3C87_2128050 [compost metagenome]